MNMVNVVNDDDNVKQDMSIDVYGRKEKEDKAVRAAWPLGLLGRARGGGWSEGRERARAACRARTHRVPRNPAPLRAGRCCCGQEGGRRREGEEAGRGGG